MSKARKHLDEQAESFILPGAGQRICRVSKICGGNLLEVAFDDDSHTLCIIPSKYRKKLWIKIGQFVIIDSAPASDDYKVQGQIAVVLNERQIDYCKSENVWPETFANGDAANKQAASTEDVFDMPNPNRRKRPDDSNDDDSDDDEDGDDGEEDAQVDEANSEDR